MNTPRDNYETALSNREKGFTSIPLHPGTKVPRVKWKRWQTEQPSPELYKFWFDGTRNNIAVITTGLVVFDVDDLAKAELVLAACGDTPCKLKTPRGVHLIYRARKGVHVGNRVDIKGVDIDIRAENGLEIQPFSTTEHGEYRWLGAGLLPVAELPVAKIGWTRERTRRHLRSVTIDDSNAVVRRARAYLAAVEGAISGQRGHDKTFRVACVLVQKFGLSVELAFPLFLEWNQQCEPPWSEPELMHKLRDAERLKR